MTNLPHDKQQLEEYKAARLAEFREKFAIAPYSLWRFGVEFTEAEDFLSQALDTYAAAAVAGERDSLRENVEKLKLLEVAVNPERLAQKVMYNRALEKVLVLLPPPPSTSEPEKRDL